MEVINEDGETPLMMAIRLLRENMVKILLKYGARVDWKYPEGDSMLWRSYRLGSKKITKMLLKKGADIRSWPDEKTYMDKEVVREIHFPAIAKFITRLGVEGDWFKKKEEELKKNEKLFKYILELKKMQKAPFLNDRTWYDVRNQSHYNLIKTLNHPEFWSKMQEIGTFKLHHDIITKKFKKAQYIHQRILIQLAEIGEVFDVIPEQDNRILTAYLSIDKSKIYYDEGCKDYVSSRRWREDREGRFY